MTYVPKIHYNGPDEIVVEDGGTITLKSGGTLAAESGSSLTIPDSAFEVGDLTLATGSVVIGAASKGAALDVKGDGKIVVGNGTTATSVAVSGDATLANTGALTIANNAVTPAKLSASVQDLVPTLSLAGTDDTDGTGTMNIQLKDAAGNNLVSRAAVRCWVSASSYGAPAAQTDFSVTTGVELQEVTADAHYLVICDNTGLIVMNINKGSAGTLYVMAELDGIIYVGTLAITGP